MAPGGVAGSCRRIGASLKAAAAAKTQSGSSMAMKYNQRINRRQLNSGASAPANMKTIENS